jgi:hypothetical protein
MIISFSFFRCHFSTLAITPPLFRFRHVDYAIDFIRLLPLRPPRPCRFRLLITPVAAAMRLPSDSAIDYFRR